ncbi:FMRFamide related propeptide [Glossina fuscipes fuscipes]
MLPLIVYLLALQHLHTSALSKILLSSDYSLNNLNQDFDKSMRSNDHAVTPTTYEPLLQDIIENVPFVQSYPDETALQFPEQISSVNIDYGKNIIVLKFSKKPRKLSLNKEEQEKRKSLHENFMRFGKRAYEYLPTMNDFIGHYYEELPGERYDRARETVRDLRGDNFMRFGRNDNQCGKADCRVTEDFMRFGRSNGGSVDFMRLGRRSGEDFMRFGRNSGNQDFMRFGRNSGNQNFMRFGRSSPDQHFIRSSRNSDFMRFGRSSSSPDFMRFGRNAFDLKIKEGKRSDNFMRFGRASNENFMRFGKRKTETKEQLISTPSDLNKKASNDTVIETNSEDKNLKTNFDNNQELLNDNENLMNFELNNNLLADDKDTLNADYVLKVSE